MVIIINGSINSGKTTISKLLKDKIPNTAHIEVDELRAFIDWMPLECAIPINLQNTISIINNFSDNNINTVVSYPMNKKEYDFIGSGLKNKEDIYFFTLSPEIEIALSERDNRKLTEWERERIKHHYSTGTNNPGFGIIIDNSTQTLEETVEEILKNIPEIASLRSQ